MIKSAVVLILPLVLLAVAPARGAGLYVGGSVGASYVGLSWENVDIEDLEISGADFAWKVFGGYKLIPFLSLEGGYRDLGSVSDSFEDIVYGAETSGWDVEAMGIIPLGVAHLWGKAGYFWWTSKTEEGGEAGEDTGSDFMWGLGADVSILMIALRLEWEKFEIEDAEHISMLSGGVTFGF